MGLGAEFAEGGPWFDGHTFAATSRGFGGAGVGAPRGPKEEEDHQAKVELDALAGGNKLKEYEVYVGRGGRGFPPSKWGNPLRLGPT